MTRRSAVLAAVLLLAVTARSADPVTEAEPNGTAAPQALGDLGPDGLEVVGALDPTSSTGLDPGDRDAFTFTPTTAGSLRVELAEADRDVTFLLSLVELDEEDPFQRAAVIGTPPLVLAVPEATVGVPHRIAVAAFDAGDPLGYRLVIDDTAALPPWTGGSCDGPEVALEPDDDILDALDLGDLDADLCAAGSLDAITPPGFEGPRDRDHLRFRTVLPTHVRVVIEAEPAALVADLQELVFVGGRSLVRREFAGRTEIVLGPVQAGSTLVLALEGQQGEAPVDWNVHVEPWVPPPGDGDAADLAVVRARWRIGSRRIKWDWRGTLDGLDGEALSALDTLTVVTGGAEEILAPSGLRLDRRGRLRFRGTPGVDGVRSLVVSPDGKVRIRGLLPNEPGGAEGPADGTLRLVLRSGERSWRGEILGEWNDPGTRWRAR